MSSNERVVLITGAASGIGRATARRLAADGVDRLVLVDRNADTLSPADFACAVDTMVGDVSDEAFWNAVAPDLAGLTGAVVNAGVVGLGEVSDLSFAEWRRVLSINLDGGFLTLRSAIRAIDGPGSIVVMSSATALSAQHRTGAYAASKAALIQLTRVAAHENAARGLRINAIAPGGVTTPLWDGVPAFAARAQQIGRDAAFAERAATSTPLGGFASADLVAGQIAFLLSDAAASMTGSVLVSDGGYSL